MGPRSQKAVENFLTQNGLRTIREFACYGVTREPYRLEKALEGAPNFARKSVEEVLEILLEAGWSLEDLNRLRRSSH